MMQECGKRHLKVTNPLLSKHPFKAVRPWTKKHGKVIPRNKHLGQMVDPCLSQKEDTTSQVIPTRLISADLQREQKSRVQNPSLLLNDLMELGMYGKLSEENCHINMPFEDVQILVTTMRMAEFILNDRVQTSRKAKMAEIKTQLDAEHCPNMSALLVELERARYALTQIHPFQSIGAFDAEAYDLEGLILFQTMLIAWAVDWLATLSIDPNAEIRRGTLSVFSELQAAYSSQRTLHELYFHHHDDTKLLEARVRGAMSELGERLTKVTVTPTGSVVQKRQNIAVGLQNIAVGLQSISALVEEMLTMAKQSYSAALTASHMYGSPGVRAQHDYYATERAKR
jgi:hypothetical protein